MNELTLEALAKRIEAIEQKLAQRELSEDDWRRSYGMFEGSEFMKQVDEEVLAMREAERQAVREGNAE